MLGVGASRSRAPHDRRAFLSQQRRSAPIPLTRVPFAFPRFSEVVNGGAVGTCRQQRTREIASAAGVIGDLQSLPRGCMRPLSIIVEFQRTGEVKMTGLTVAGESDKSGFVEQRVVGQDVRAADGEALTRVQGQGV